VVNEQQSRKEPRSKVSVPLPIIGVSITIGGVMLMFSCLVILSVSSCVFASHG
jgi:hypothetical protein